MKFNLLKVVTLVWGTYFLGNSSSFATKYYVGSSGSDANSALQAQSPGSPWQTVVFAISQVAVGDSIVVLQGTYSETNVSINKSIHLFGNETAGIPGTGAKPVFNGTSGTPSGSIFILNAPGIVIRNFEIHVNQADVIRGIFSNGGGYNRVEISDNHIFSVSTLAPTIFNSYGIQLGTTSIQAGQDSFLIARNQIRPQTPGSALFGRAIRLVGGYGRIGGSDPADSNQLRADYGVQAGDIKNRIHVENNHFFGLSAGLELNIPAANRTHTIANNWFEPTPGFNALCMIELKNNTLSNSVINIKGNRFIGHPISALFSTRSRNVFVEGNTFIPSDTAQNYIHIAVNTKQQTTANDASTASSITVTSNNFFGNNTLKGTAISFQDHNSGTTPPFPNTVIGGSTLLANTFSQQLGRFVMLDTASGPSTQNPLWNQAGYKVTLMRPVNQRFDLSGNLFDVGSGMQRPGAMTEADQILLEDKVLHGVDFDSLGFVTMVNQTVFLTQTSFVSPLTTQPSIQRAINQVQNADGWSLLASPGTYPGRATVFSQMSFDAVDNQNVTSSVLDVAGSGKVLTINDPFTITDSLKLRGGIIALGDSPLTMGSSAVLQGGSPISHIQTNGGGQFTYLNQDGSSKLYPVGTSSAYYPLQIANTGTADQLGVRVQADVLSGGLTGSSVDSVVNATWVATEGTSGGSNLSITAGWSGSAEKPFFDRANTVMQGHSGAVWSDISNSPVTASGSDPYSGVYSSVSSALNSLPIRIRTVATPTIVSNLYYVDDNTGDDSRTSEQAKDPNTPWLTIGKALATLADGDSVQVMAGTYSEFDLLINKKLTLLGNLTGVGVGVGAGTGVKPVVNGIGPSPLDSSIFIVRAANVNIRNFNIKVDIDRIKLGINAPVTGFNGLIIEDNLIQSTADFVSGGIDVVVLSHAILLGRLTGSNGNGNDSIIVRRNVIDREGPGKKWFSRGVRWWGGKGMIGGFNPADGNEVHADFAVQCGGGNIGGRLQTRNNTLFGRAAGVEYNTPPPTYIHTIANNTIQPLDNGGHFALVEIKSNIRTTGPSAPAPPFIDIENNTLTDFYNIGVAITRSRNCRVLNNIFTPRADSTRYRHVWVNSKQRTAGTAASQPPLSSVETFIQGNTFNGNNVLGGYGIAFQNANVHSSGKVFTINSMGGVGALANTFGATIDKMVYLDTITGPSSNDPFWSKPGVNWVAWPSTPTAPVRDNFDFSENLYDMGSGAKRPADMTNAELLLLENRVVHKIDADTLGFVTMKAGHVFVTQQSFISPLTTTPRLQRAVNAAGAVDGVTVNIETGTYNGQTSVAQSLIFDASPDGEVTSEDLGMNGSAKTITLSDPFKLSASLRLTEGNIDIGTSDLTMANSATVTGGSLTSHVVTNGAGFFVHENLATTAKRYPVGTGSRYALTQISNSGTADNIGLKVNNDVLTNGLTGTPQDTVVDITYLIREATTGGSGLVFAPEWSAANERPVFDRSQIFAEQHNGANWQNIGPATPSVAIGTDPYSVFIPISGSWNNQPVRVIGRAPAALPTGVLYYVDDASGSDTRTNAEATNPVTPWKTMTKALASIASGDSVQVFAGTYPEANLTVTKSVYLFGNVVGIGTGPGAGTGVKPVFNGTSGTPQGSIFILQADSVLIQNFEIRVNQIDVIRGIFSNGGGYNRLRVLDNHVFSTSTLAPSIFNSYGIQLGTTSIQAGQDSFLIARNVIRPLTVGSAKFGRGIRLLGGFGMIGGGTLADSNSIMGDYGIQSGDIRSTFQCRNNHIWGTSAGVELNIPAANRTHTIANNKLEPAPGFNALAMIEIKNNTRTGSQIQINGNQFLGHPFIGVFSTRSRNVTVDGNTFTPSDTAQNYIHIAVNNKQQTTATDAATASSITITGNGFQGNSTNKGTAIAFQNHNSGVIPAFPATVIGGDAALANTFGPQVGQFILLDTASGLSTQNPIWNQTNYKTTLMRPVSDDFDVSKNLFDLGGGPVLPTAMSEANLLALENRIIHGVDYDSLGFAKVKDMSVYVTQNSFVAPFHSTASLQRAINQADNNDGWTLLAESGTYPGRAQVAVSMTVDVAADLNMGASTLEMNGAGKTLTLNNELSISDSLKLSAGTIRLADSNLILGAGAILNGGSINSYVHTSGLGQFTYASQNGSSKIYPVGTSNAYFPLSITNSGTADQLGLRVQADVLSGGLSGSSVDSVVNATWVATEGTVGGSNLSVTATWAGADEKPFFDRAASYVQGFTGGWINISAGPVAASGSDPYTATFTGIQAGLNALPLRISSALPQVTGDIYYVDDNIGDDSRSNAEAQDPNTPWRTIGKALGSTFDGDSIQVFEGTYNESNLRITKSLKIFGNVVGVGTGIGAGTGIRPIVNGSSLGADSSIFTVQASDVLLKNFRIEVDQVLIINGILSKSPNYNRVQILNNRILSNGLNPLPPSLPCLRFNTYGIRLVGFGTDSILIQGNEIEPSAVDGSRCVFGRGIKLFGGHGLIGGPNDLDSNRILAYYDIQAGDIDGGRLIIENNFSVGIGVQIVAPAANSGIHEVRNNNLFIAFPQFFPNLIELKDIQKPGTGVLVTGNRLVGFSNAGIFSQRSQNVSIVSNLFIPSDTAARFRHVVVNTKQETTSGNQPPVPSSIRIQANDFRGTSVAGRGTALEFGNHNDDPASSTAFTNVVIGGAGSDANTFGGTLGQFMVLDPLSGSSSSIPFWSNYPSTDMHPIADTFDISNNQFGVAGGLKLPSAMTEDELYEVEDKVSHAIDYDSLGFVKVKPTFAFVTDSSFLRPFHTVPSVQRAVNAASSDGWQVNIEPSLLSETVTVNKSITFNTYPLDSMRLGGIAMNGLDKTLTLSDKFTLLNALTLNNPVGGRIRIGDNNLYTQPSAVVTQGSINSYVITNGLGSLVRRGVNDQATFFPVGTEGSYAPVLFDDANNTADNFRIKVKPTSVNADFTPPLPGTIDTFVKFQWDICEDVAGGSDASLTFDWIDPANVTGAGIINGISRNDGTNWNSVLATIGPGLTASAQGFQNFCSPFAVVADPSLTSITTENPIKVLPGVSGRYCIGDSIRIPFTVQGTGIISGNAFNAFLSDADGTFPASGGVLIGSMLGQVSDTIDGVIPAATVPGLNYRIRVVSTNVAITGTANPDSIKIFGLPARPTITGDSAICSGQSATLTSSAATTYQWAPGGANTQSISATTAGVYRVTIGDDNGCLNTSAARNLTVNTTPVADTISYTQPLARCVGDSLILTANPAGLSYLWLNTTPTVTSQTLTVKTSGTYQVVVSSGSCADTSAALAVTFNALPTKPVATLADNDLCQPDTLRFGTVATATGYEWSISGVTPNPNTQNVKISDVGTYTGSVTVTDANGCKNTSDPVTGVLRQAPARPTISALDGDFSVCEGDSIRLQAVPFSASNTYTWQPGGFVGGTLVLKLPGQLTASVSVDSAGCTSTNLLNILTNINPRPAAPTVTVSSGTTEFCPGDSAVLTSSAGLRYRWTPGSDTTQAIVVKTTGSYSVVTLSDSGCASLSSNSVTINAKPAPAKPLVAATSTIFCFGLEATLSVTNPVAANTYSWTPAGTGTSITVSATGSYFVKADSTNGCSSVSDPLGITVNPLPEPVITAKNNRTEVCQGDSVVLVSNYPLGNQWSNNATSDSIVIKSTLGVTLTVTDQNNCSAVAGPVQVVVNALPRVRLEKDTALVFPEDLDLVAVDLSQSALRYRWATGGSVFDSTDVNSKRIVPDKSAYYVVTLVDTNGCIATDSVLVRVSRELYVPNVFSPNGDGKNDVFKVYGFGVASIEVKVWDRLGNLVYETTNPDDIVETSLTNDSVKGWNGKYKDKEVGQESYIWSVKGKLTTGEDIKVRGGKNSGSVTIMN